MADTLKELRPDISSIDTAAELKRWYWLKDELVAQAKHCGVKSTGAKFVILERLAHFLDTGQTNWPGDDTTISTSKFDWHKDPLDLETVLSNSYKNTQNVRRFFCKHVGPDFKFNIAFMEWMKSNSGKTLADAVDEFKLQQKQMTAPGFKTVIEPHNQFNQYTRDILTHNPNMKMSDVRRIWALKRALPSENGRHAYEHTDLDLTDE